MEGAAFTGGEAEEYVLLLSCPKLDLCTVWIAAEGEKEQKREILKTRRGNTPVRAPSLTIAQPEYRRNNKDN